MSAADQQYTRAQIRDLLVEFYSRVDPARLEAGIDISGMCDWVLYNGISDMQMRLVAKYGQGLNFDLLRQQSEASGMSAMHRISVMPNTQLIEQQRKRLELRQAVEDFYKANDPAKLPQVDSFCEWIEANSIVAFNTLLMKKYGKTLASERPKPTPPQPPAMPARPNHAPSNAGTEAPPPPPSHEPEPEPEPEPEHEPDPPATAAPEPDAKLVVELKQFYKFHDEADMDVKDVALWAMAVGRERLNEKLLQLYGGSLETLDADIAKANAPPPPPPEEDIPPPEEEPTPAPAPPPAPAQAPAKATPPPAKPTPPVPPPAVAAALPKITKLQKPTPPAMPPSLLQKQPSGQNLVAAASTPAPLVKQSSGPVSTLTKPVPPSLPASLATVKPAPPPAGKPGASQQRKRRPSEGACDNYVLDLSGEGFGVCVCGFNRSAHGQPKIAPDRRSLKIKTVKEKEAKPCHNYRVDIAGKTFGDCLCGWPKAEHGKVNWEAPIDPLSADAAKAKPVKPVAPVAPMAPAFIPKPGGAAAAAAAAAPSKPTPAPSSSTPKGSSPRAYDKYDLEFKQVWFDAPTTTVYKMMVDSYAEQHGADPSDEMKIEWATNLYSLSSKTASAADGGLHLRIKHRR